VTRRRQGFSDAAQFKPCQTGFTVALCPAGSFQDLCLVSLECPSRGVGCVPGTTK
jgi:hypothetical protein